MISVAVLVAVVKQHLFKSLLCFTIEEVYFLSVNCNTEFWSLSSDYGVVFWTGTRDFSHNESQDSSQLFVTKITGWVHIIRG